MCGRFRQERGEIPVRAAGIDVPTPQGPSPERQPGDLVRCVVSSREEGTQPRVARWGWPADWEINSPLTRITLARRESVGVKRTFRDAFLRSRALIPVSEWTETEYRTRRSTRIAPAHGPQLIAALWRIVEREPRLVLITHETPAEARHVHHRAPLILGPEEAALWIDPRSSGDQARAAMDAARVPLRILQEAA